MKMQMTLLTRLEMEPKQKIDARVIALDETEYYTIDEEIKPYIKSIEGIYLYDKNQHVPTGNGFKSYYLMYIGTRVVFHELVKQALTQDEIERICYLYEDTDSEDIYMHCRDIDRLEAYLSTLPFRYHVEGEEELPDDFTYEEFMEDLYEDFRCNHRL
jgi:predicted DNA-binding protein